MKIGILSWHLGNSYGGTEKFSMMLANEMIMRKHDVTIFISTVGKISKNSFMLNNVYNRCNIYNLHMDINLFKKPESLGKYDDKIQNASNIINSSGVDVIIVILGWYAADLAFSSMSNYLTIKTIASVRNSPNKIDKHYGFKRHLAMILNADAIHVLFDSYKEYYPQFLHSSIVSINNTIKACHYKVQKTSRSKRIFSCGRFDDPIKNFSTLIKAVIILHKIYPDWILTICGDGKSMESYLNLISDNNANDYIYLPGSTNNIDSYLQNSDIFCIPSLYEGFPNVILEAQAHFLPIVGFSSCQGVNELIIDNYNGYLVNTNSELYLSEKLASLMESESIRDDYGNNSYLLLENYDYNKTFDKWENFINKVINYDIINANKESLYKIYINFLHTMIRFEHVDLFKKIHQYDKILKT